MKLKSTLVAVGLLATGLPLAPAHAEIVTLIGSGTQLPGSLDTGDSGTGTVQFLGLWGETADSGDTIVEITLPEYFEINGTPTADVWPATYGYSRGSAWVDSNGRAVLRPLNGTGQVSMATASDYACGMYGFDVDPTDGTLFALLGRRGSPTTSDCSTGTRWLAKYNASSGKWEWIGQMNYFHGIEFLGDGTLMAIAGSGVGRGNIYTVDKTSAATTYRLNPSPGNDYSDMVYNPGDGKLYVTDDCYLHRVNPSDWTYTTVNDGAICNIRYGSSALLDDNRFLVRHSSGFYDLSVDATDGSLDAVNASTFGGNGNWPRAPMIASKTDRATVNKTCSATGTRIFSCNFGSVSTRAGVYGAVPVKFTIPSNAFYGTRQGEIKWYRGGSVIASRSLELTVLAPDVGITLSPSSNRYLIGNTDTFTIDIEALGGKAVNDVKLDVEIPSSILTVTSIGGAGTCGLSRVGVTCSNIDVSAGGTQTVTINFRAEADGFALVGARLTVGAGDVDGSNDAASANIVVGNATDLEASGPASTKGSIGTAMNVEVKVSGRGPDDALNSVLTIPGNAGFKLGTATTDTGTCAAAGDDIKCALGTMAADVTATVSVSVTPTRPGNLKLPFKATSDLLDLTPGNNTYPFEVSVPTNPFVVTLGGATPAVSRGDVRAVLQLAVAPSDNGGIGMELSSVSGTMAINVDGLNLKRKVLVFNDADGNGAYDETDELVGSGVLSAEGDAFTLEFSRPVSAPAGKTTNLLLAMQAEGAPSVAGVFGGSSNNWVALAFAGLLPFALAALAFGRRRAALAVVAGLTLGLFGACSELDDLLDNAKVTVTVTSVAGNLQDDARSPVAATGLPITGPTVTLTR